ncbi:oligosaccharide flippase family protein [Bacteroides mediterraneensis]|uniref:oligosaccharide flippase family protein n=1 Tax=Bacteroides mediterraneensis TaxID=1841856 RepID=UPI0026EA4F56|nr:oligosaccharide flippase family protein [Bacteroides mediterraneensis]
MADNKRIAKNTMILYFRMMLVMLVSLYTSRVILRNLGVEDYGLYNVVGGIVSMFTFLNGSLGAATSRYITFELGKKDYSQLNKIFNTALIIHVIIGLIIILLSETIGLWFFYNKMTIPVERLDAAFWTYQISIFTCFISLTQVPYNATINAHENMSVYAYISIVETISKLIIVYFISIAPFDKLIFYALLLCLLQVSIMIFYRIYCIKTYKETHINLQLEKGLFKEMFSYGGADMIGNISVLAQGQGLNLLLNMFFGPTVNAARAIAYQVQGAASQFSNNFFAAVSPQIVKLYAEGKTEDMMKLMKNSSCFSFYLMWIIALPIILETHYILTLWLKEFPDHTIVFLHLIFILCLIQTIKSPRTRVYHATGHIKLSNLTVGIVLCAAFPLAYLFLKLGYGPESVFWAANLSMILSEFISVFVLKRYIKYSIKEYLFHVHFRCLVVAVISFIIPFILHDKYFDESFFRLIYTCILTTICSFITIWFLGMDKSMRNTIIEFIKKKMYR